MNGTGGYALFFLAPGVLATVLLWRFPAYRRFRWRSLLIYVVAMSLIIWGALELVAWLASGRVVYTEIPLILWFTIAWRLAWEIWSQTVGCWGRNWQRCRRIAPFMRATVTAFIFVPAFISTVATHRFKLADGQDPTSVFRAPYEHVQFPTADGLLLDGWFVPDERGSDRTIIICHGAGANKGNFIWFLGPLLNRGYNVMFFDFRAHGGSEGRTTTYGIREQADVVAAVDWLKQHKPDCSRTVVGLGSSQGAFALATAAANDRRIDAVILDSPFVSPRELVHDKMRRLPLIGPVMGNLLLTEVSLQTGTSFFRPSAERAVRAIGPRPVMVIHGEADIAMPASHSQRLYDAAAGPRTIWFGPGPHSNIVTEAPGEYGQRVLAFLEANFGRADNSLKPVSSAPATGQQKER